ncbi:MAG: biotin/lipoyl-containing protein [Anaerolineales bacterium]
MSKYKITIEDKEFIVEVGDVSTSPAKVVVNGEPRTVAFEEADVEEAGPAVEKEEASEAPAEPEPEPETAPEAEAEPVSEPAGNVVAAPMPGKVLSVVVEVGDSVSEGDNVCTLEAMKMEMSVSATASGTVQAIHVREGDNVVNDDPLVSIE